MYQSLCCNCCESAAYVRSFVALVTLVSNFDVMVLLSLSHKFNGQKFVTVWDLKVKFFFKICILFTAFFSNSHSVKLHSVTTFRCYHFPFFRGNNAASHPSKNTVCILSHCSNIIDYSSRSCSNISIKCTVTANANQTFIVAVVTLYS